MSATGSLLVSDCWDVVPELLVYCQTCPSPPHLLKNRTELGSASFARKTAIMAPRGPLEWDWLQSGENLWVQQFKSRLPALEQLRSSTGTNGLFGTWDIFQTSFLVGLLNHFRYLHPSQSVPQNAKNPLQMHSYIMQVATAASIQWGGVDTCRASDGHGFALKYEIMACASSLFHKVPGVTAA